MTTTSQSNLKMGLISVGFVFPAPASLEAVVEVVVSKSVETP